MLRTVKAWEEINEDIKGQVTDVSYRTWFQPLCPEKIDEEKKVIYLTTSNDFAAEVVSNRYNDVLTESVERVLGKGYKAQIRNAKGSKVSKGENPITDGVMFNGIKLNVSKIEVNKDGKISKVILVNPEA